MSYVMFTNRIVRCKKYSYEWWYNAPVQCIMNQDENQEDLITHGEYVKKFYYKMKNLLNEMGYDIDEEKEFKNGIATLIYKLSDDHL